VNVGRGVRRRSAASAPQVRLGVGAKGCVWLRKAWGSARKDALGPLRRPAQRESKFVAAGTARRARTAGPPGIRVSRGRSGRPCFWPGGIVKSLQNATSAHASRWWQARCRNRASTPIVWSGSAPRDSRRRCDRHADRFWGWLSPVSHWAIRSKAGAGERTRTADVLITKQLERVVLPDTATTSPPTSSRRLRRGASRDSWSRRAALDEDSRRADRNREPVTPGRGTEAMMNDMWTVGLGGHAGPLCTLFAPYSTGAGAPMCV